MDGRVELMSEDMRVRCVRGSSESAGKMLGIFLMAMSVVACRQPSREPVTLTFFRPGWSQHDQKAERLLQQFTQETGIHVKDLPVPESTLDAMNLSRRLLHQDGSGPDVLGVDVSNAPKPLGRNLPAFPPVLRGLPECSHSRSGRLPASPANGAAEIARWA